MEKIEIFVQGAGISQVSSLEVPADGRVRDVLLAARGQGFQLPEGPDLMVWLEDQDEGLKLDETLNKAGVKNRARLHIHTCRRVKVTVNYQNSVESHPFAPSATVGKVKTWAVRKFNISDAEATEYALQLCNSTERPSEELHLGMLVAGPECAVCFDLVPKQRVEG